MLGKFPLPYYAVIFTSLKATDDAAYNKMNDRMEKMAAKIPGFLGHESARGQDGLGITISYWESEVAINKWRQHDNHNEAKAKGINDWYAAYSIRISKVEHDIFFEKN